MKSSNIFQIAQLTVITAVSAFAISVVVLGHWWSSPAAPPPRVNLEQVNKEIVSALQNGFDTGEGKKEYGLRVAPREINLINVTGTGNQYMGLAHVTTQKGTDVSLSLTVYADASGSWIYDIDPSSIVKLTTQAEKDKSGW